MGVQNLPGEFVTRLGDIVPANRLDTTLKSFALIRPLVVRVNTLRVSSTEAQNGLRHIGIEANLHPSIPNAIVIPHAQRELALQSQLYEQGWLYAQGLASQLVPWVLAPQAGEEILDLCAAPGGKTLQMACMMSDQGRIAAVEKIKARFYKLKANITWQGPQCIQTYLKDGIPLWRKVPERFDRVLLDAPCSSEARINSQDESSFSHWSEKKIKDMVKKQRGLGYSALQSLKPGGVLVYSTCSFAPEENEGVINWLLGKFDNAIELQDISLPLNNVQSALLSWRNKDYHASLNKAVRILPDASMSGFFICKMIKTRSTLD